MRYRLLTSHPHLLAGLCFLVLTVAMTWPVVMHLNTHVTPGHQRWMTVPYLNLWTLAWNHHWMKGHADSYWDANLFYPHQQTLAYSEPQFGMGLLSFPLACLDASTVFAYNALLLAFVWGAGMAVYALCWYLFGKFEKDVNFHLEPCQIYRWSAALTAGILYGFNFYMFSEMGVLQLMATLFPPLTFLGLHWFLDNNRWIDALLFCVGFLGCWYTCSYYGLFLSVFIFCFVLKFYYRKVLKWKTLFRGAVTTAITLLCLVPLVVGMQSAKTAMGLSRPKDVVQNLSVVFSDYLKLPQKSWLYGKILGVGSSDLSMFLGGLLLCFAGVGAILIFRTRFLSNTVHTQSIKTVRFPERYGLFYIAMAGLAFWLSFGMALTPTTGTGLGVYRVIAWFSPYNLLYQFVPGFSSIRSAKRFLIFCTLFLVVLAGWGMLWLFKRVRPRWRPVIVSVIVTMVLLEIWPLPLRLVKVPRSIADLPPIYQHVKKLPPTATLLELPMARGRSERQFETEARSVYYSIFHWHKVANGYSGFSPGASIGLREVIAEKSPETVMSAFKTFGIQYILTHEDNLNAIEKKKLQRLEGTGLIPLAREGGKRLYQVAFNSTSVKVPLPSVERLTFYENRTYPDHVVLCLYYELGENDCELTTPWHRRIECEVVWYAALKQSEPVLISTGIYRNSRLLTKTSNAVELDLRAPPPGEYRVVVRQSSDTGTVPKSGVCHIYENGFVTFSRLHSESNQRTEGK